MHDQLRAEMQSQIDQLKLQLSNSIAQLQEAQQHAAAANAASNEGHGFSRAVKACVRDGFSRRGTLFETHRAKSSLRRCVRRRRLERGTSGALE